MAKRRPPALDAVTALEGLQDRLVEQVLPLLSRTSVFLHPDTVAQTQGRALFPIVRNSSLRAQFTMLDSGERVMYDDNTSPREVFLWAANRGRGKPGNPVQYNHVWDRAKDPHSYTALWNLFCSPKLFSQLTDVPGPIQETIRFHSWHLYGYRPEGSPEPARPTWYEDLEWAPHPERIDDLMAVMRTRLTGAPRSRMASCAKEIGWLFNEATAG